MTVPTVSPPLAAARELMRKGKYDEALAAYKPIADAGGADGAAAYAGIARVYLRQRNPEAALDAANKGVALAPGTAPAIVALGEVYFRMGEILEAQKSFIAPILKCIPDARAHLGLARIDLATSNYHLAKMEADAAHRLDESDPDIDEFWAAFQPKEERVKFLRDRLGHAADDDAEAREGMRESLTVLLDELDKPDRSCHQAAPLTAATASLSPLRAEQDVIYGYALDVKLNGVSAHLQLDTGASGILVNPKTAEKAGIKPIIRTEFGGIGDKGPVGGFVGNADSVKIGSLEFQRCYVTVSQRKLLPDSDGLIGGDVFAHYLVDIDLPDAKFKLTQLPALPDEAGKQSPPESQSNSGPSFHDRYVAPEMKDYTRVLRFGDHLLVPTRVNDSAPKLFLLDTGSFDNMISKRAAKENTRLEGDYDTELKGLSGKVNQVYRADAVNLIFSHFNQRRDDLIAFDMTGTSQAMGTEVSGILGFGMLRLLDIKIDYRDGLVDFQYDPHRLH